MHETEISVAVILVEEKGRRLCQHQKHEKELEDLQAGVKYRKIYHIKEAKSDDEGATIFLVTNLNTKKKRMAFALIPELHSCPTHCCQILTLLGDDQYIVCAMKRDVTAHELSFTVIVALQGRGITSTFIILFVYKLTEDHWRIGNSAGTTMVIKERQKIRFLIPWK